MVSADPAPAGAVTVSDLARILAGLRAPASPAGLIDETRELEDLKSALAARQARHAVAFDLAQRREQADAGIPADQLGTGVGAQLALGPAGIPGPRRPAPGPGESPRHRDAAHPRRPGNRAAQRMARDAPGPRDRVPDRRRPDRRRRRTRPRHRDVRRGRRPCHRRRGPGRRLPARPALRHPACRPRRGRTSCQPPPGPGHHVLPHRPAPGRGRRRRARCPHPARRRPTFRRGRPHPGAS